MKTLNKTLSLVLVLVMVFSLFGVASAAKLGDFTDKTDVTYTEAVDYLTAAGVVAGDTTTTINPKGDFTREQAAKLVAYACLGQVAADAIKAPAAPFTDVAADRWSAGYIAYCAKQGILNGMGDGTFAPTAKVTGYQLGKMLLCAIGFGVNGEYTGTGWELSVAKDSLAYGIFEGNTAGANNTVGATREEAFLYTFNTLSNLQNVSYNAALGLYYVPGSSMTTSNPKCASTDLQRTTSIGYIRFDMKKVNGETGDYGEAAHYWQKDGKKVTGKYADNGVKLLASSTDGTTFAKLTTSSNAKYIGYKADDAVAYFYNGDNYIPVAGAANASTNTCPIGTNILAGTVMYTTKVALTGTSTDLTNITNASVAIASVPVFDGKKGVEVLFYDTDNNGKYDTVNYIQARMAKVTSDAKAVVSGSITQVTVNGISGLQKIDSTKVKGYEGLVKDDVVTYYQNLDGDYYITKCTVVTGTMAAYNDSAATALINGTQYKVSELRDAYDLAGNKSTFLGTANSSFYLDKGGFIVNAKAGNTDAKLDNTLFLVASNAAGMSMQAQVLKSDGSSSAVTIAKIDDTTITGTTTMTDYHNKFYTFTVNSNGAYVLKNVTNATYGTGYVNTNPIIVKNTANAFYTSTGSTQSGKLATSSTVFVLETKADTFKAYTGIAAVPTYKEDSTVDAKAGILYDTNGYIIFAVALNGTPDNSTVDSDYIFAATPATEVYNADGNYYTYLNTSVNGTIKPMQNATGNTSVIPGKLQAVATYDGDKVATVATTDTRIGTAVYDVNDINVNGTTVSYENTGDTTIDGAYVVSSDCKYFLYDVTDYNNPTLTASSADEIDGLNGDHYAIQTLAKSNSDTKTVVQMYVTVYPVAQTVNFNSVVLAAGAGADKATINTASTSYATIADATDHKAAVVAADTDHDMVKFTSANPFTAKLGAVSLITNASPLTLTTVGMVNTELAVPVTEGDYTYAITYYTYAFVPVTVYYVVTVSNT